jgi:Ca2+-binding EF-hand superfamily protein
VLIRIWRTSYSSNDNNNNLQSIFDEDNNGQVEYKELVIGLEILREDSIEEKMNVFFDLVDINNNGSISEKELYEVFKANIMTSDDRNKLKKIIEKLFQECDKNHDGVLDKEEILEAAKNNITLRQLLEESIRNVK